MAKQTVKPENAPAKIRALREEIAKLKASMAELEEEPVDHARAIARLEAGLEEIFDAPARQLIAETAAQLRSPGETGAVTRSGAVADSKPASWWTRRATV